MWKKLATKTILKHPRLTVVEDEVELPDGHRSNYVRFEGQGNAATVIAFNDESKILVLKEYAYPANEWLYQFPGGMVPESEDVELGANRELMEEAHLKANDLKVLGSFYPTIRRSNAKSYVVLAYKLSEEKREKDLEEEMELFWFTEDEIDQLIRENKFMNGSSLGAWALYKSYK